MAILIPCSFSPLPKPIPKFKTPTLACTPSKLPLFSSKPSLILRSRTLITSSSSSSSSAADFTIDVDGVAEDELSEGSPWEGAIVYKRDASVTHLEYCTTLERLGLGHLSSGTSRAIASAMGIRLPRRKAKELEAGGNVTPVLVSVDVTRRKRRVKLDGIVRTVITLPCYLCCEPAAESVFSNFCLLLTEDPIEESDVDYDIELMNGKYEDHSKMNKIFEDEEDDEGIDSEDMLYFPREQKEIDISKPIRDLVHLEIKIDAVCDANCKGLCLLCGANLNKSSCTCNDEEVEDGDYGPLKNLRKRIQQI